MKIKINSPDEILAALERILLRVQKPGRYTGGELNQVKKNWEVIPIHFALVFPDIYDIGLPNLGLAILYDELNKRNDTLAERAYSPWLDMEGLMREVGIPLFSLESKHPLSDFDIIGFTFPYETLYTNTLNILDLAGIPLYKKDRSKKDPILIAGGNATTNPEPMSEFIDAFVIGEGEEIIHEIIDSYKHWKEQSGSRIELLQSLSRIWGIYIPEFYSPKYHSDGTISFIQKEYDQAPLPVKKRFVPKLPPPTTHFIVPSIDVVHNRVSIEIMRGCSRGCRFCHAGMVYRPVRERTVDEILLAIQNALDQTGFEEVVLLSLSSSDYSRINELVKRLGEIYCNNNLTISLPSLRIESFSVDIMEKLKGFRQGGFTLAPEAGSESMRNIINKPISTQKLLEIATEVYSKGWSTLKLYFMIGHPSETIEDVEAIANLCKTVLKQGKAVAGNRANLHVSVSTFVPKPHTPFQWISSESLDTIALKQKLLKKELKTAGIKINWTDPKGTLLETWLSRGDRRMSDVIFQAWKSGAKFDAWQDQFNYDAWKNAFSLLGIDEAFYTTRQRSTDEIFPWDHINLNVRKNMLIEDFEWSQSGRLRPDCREHCYACGILPSLSEIRQQFPGGHWKCPERLSEGNKVE